MLDKIYVLTQRFTGDTPEIIGVFSDQDHAFEEAKKALDSEGGDWFYYHVETYNVQHKIEKEEKTNAV